MSDYIPQTDGHFDSWQKNFLIYASAHVADLGLTPADIAPLTALQTAWTTEYTAHTAAQNAARAAREAKENALLAYENAIRLLVRQLQASPHVTDDERRALGITVKDEARTITTAKAAATRPIGIVDTSERLRHTIRFYDEATPNKRAKPEGVMGCEIWVKIGDPLPMDGSQCIFLGLDTASPYVAEYEGKNAGLKAHYMLRWVTTRGDKGPWSETISATIAG